MTLSTHLPSPSADEIRAVLDATHLSTSQAAAIMGVTTRAVQQALAGDTTLRGSSWRLLLITLFADVRASLPPPLLQSMPA